MAALTSASVSHPAAWSSLMASSTGDWPSAYSGLHLVGGRENRLPLEVAAHRDLQLVKVLLDRLHVLAVDHRRHELGLAALVLVEGAVVARPGRVELRLLLAAPRVQLRRDDVEVVALHPRLDQLEANAH